MLVLMLIFWPMTVDSAPPGRLWRGSQTHSSQGLSNQHYDFSRVIVQVPINLHLQKKKKKISPNSDNLRLIDIKAKHKTVCVLLSRNTRGLDIWISHLHINNKENRKLHWHQSHNVTGLSTPPLSITFLAVICWDMPVYKTALCILLLE